MEGIVFGLIVGAIYLIYSFFDAPRMKKEKAAEMKLKEDGYLAEMTPQERKDYMTHKERIKVAHLKVLKEKGREVKSETELEEYATEAAVSYFKYEKYQSEKLSKSSKLVCPHCQMKGGVSSTFGEEVSKTKVVPIIGNTIKTRKDVTKMHCSNCDTEWSV